MAYRDYRKDRVLPERVIIDAQGNWHDAWEYERRDEIERLARKMAEQCAQDPDAEVCLGQPDRVQLPGTVGYRIDKIHPARAKPLWRYYETLAILAIKELKDGEATSAGIGLPPGPTSSVT